MEFLNDIAKSFGTLTPNLTFIVIMTIIILYFLKDAIVQFIQDVKIWKRKKKVKNLINHDVFITADVVKDKVKRISFTTHGQDDKVKTKLLQFLIEIKIESLKELLRKFLHQEGVEKYNGQKLKFEVNKVLLDLVTDYSSESHSQFIEMGVSPEDSKFLIDSFESFREDIMDGYIERIESISTNEDYNSNYDRISAMLEVIALGLFVIPKDATNACDFINGRFLKYKNI